jgi:glutamine synthetase
MSEIRFSSIENVLNRVPVEVRRPSERISEFFRENVFDHEAMKKHLPEDAFISVMTAIGSGQKIDRSIADQVALSMKSWAIGKGATHFTHWFQPLTGTTAEKHDTFFVPGVNGDGKGIESFTGSALVQQEPDASSFPSGGLRATFEARGYTAWDPSSPAFIMEIGGGKTLCIPTIFVSYNGEALDFKAPLLKSVHELQQAAVAVCHYFDRNVTHVTPTLGWEQEYFLVDAALFYARPDLVLSGRTVFGHAPAKGQQLEDHYFGSIPERTYRFMMDLETECWKLGIPVRTRHNEVAPAQFECAPTFEDVNLAVDHNQLLMDVMDRIARKHKLRVLFHEKPYAGINGSGKHNNWSMGTDTGKNLLSPGRTPKTNLQFLTFFLNVIKAVHDHDDLLRASIASAGNDFRLGANEAPPAIISIFIGDQLMDVMDEIEAKMTRGELDEQDRQDLKLNIHNKIPDVLLDNTDRNRTSPFAFTGNKFEFRAVGSSANCSGPMTVLNTIMASQLRAFRRAVDKRVKGGEAKDEAILKELRSIVKNCKRILFEGDNYSSDWHKEAAKRGLSNVKDTPRALDAMVSRKSVELFRESNVLNERELHARHDILLHNYTLKIQIEGRVIGDLAINHILPAAIRYQNQLLTNIQGLKAIKAKNPEMAAQLGLCKEISEHVQQIKSNVDKMTEARKKANKVEETRAKAIAYCDNVKPYFDIIREHVDALEEVVDDRMWPLPKYRELLFVR